jgi:hypothetical protein
LRRESGTATARSGITRFRRIAERTAAKPLLRSISRRPICPSKRFSAARDGGMMGLLSDKATAELAEGEKKLRAGR